MTVYSYTAGPLPLLMSIPHLGEEIPADIASRLLPSALGSDDTDWYLDRLYSFATDLGFSILQAKKSRYVIDLNRDPSGTSLYPGADTTELCPTSSFSRQPLYAEGNAPGDAEIAARVATYWRPYHDEISQRLAAMRAEHGVALLFDCHSIRSRVPRFFAGRLPDFNLGTGGGSACAPELETRLAQALRQDPRYETAVNGRFKGGYITRHYGQPAHRIHAFQLELSMATYSDENLPRPTYDAAKAAQLRPSLQGLLQTAKDWILSQSR
mgnify:FL=1|tara:strand:+ start:3843 stop:4646 length:804 start_codon:yes stop_codon:yes gene_type:complete